MSNVRLALAIVLTAIATAILTSSFPARAQAPRTVECRAFGGTSTVVVKDSTAWLTEQLAAGRTSFLAHGPLDVWCAF